MQIIEKKKGDDRLSDNDKEAQRSTALTTTHLPAHRKRAWIIYMHAINLPMIIICQLLSEHLFPSARSSDYRFNVRLGDVWTVAGRSLAACHTSDPCTQSERQKRANSTPMLFGKNNVVLLSPHPNPSKIQRYDSAFSS